ncbi:MAG: phage tail protein [Blastocatellia bacterium]|nr:MAG: phage tail protein [Blastocatellia bacterium]
MAVAERDDPYLSCRFAVEIDQRIVAGFNEVSGLEFESTVETFREGGVNLYEHQLSGPTKFPSRLVLKRGITDAEVLWSWHQDITRGLVKRKDVSILLLDSTGEEQWRWSFRDAAPVKWTGPQFRAATAEVAIETLELVHKGLVQR